jgi:hypothetical protein
MKLTRRSPMDYRQDSADIEFSINQMKSSLAHQTSKLEMMNKHLAIIGSKTAAEMDGDSPACFSKPTGRGNKLKQT